MRTLTIILWICLIVSLISAFFLDDLSFQRYQGPTTPLPLLSPDTSRSTDDIIPLTGTLLATTKHSNPRSQRSDMILGQSSFLSLWLYSWTNKTATHHLKELAEQGSDIRIILEDKQYRQYSDAFGDFADIFSGYDNVSIQSDRHLGTNFNHTKTFINDSRVSIQTANVTHSAFTSNREHFFLTQNETIRQNLLSLFNKDRSGTPLIPSDIHPNLLVCPIDCRDKLITLLSSSQDQIRMMHQYMTDDTLQDIIKTKKQYGLDVRLIFSDHDSAYDLQDYLGPNVVRIMTSPHNHSKTILIDDTYLVIGSMNLSPNAMDNNREISIITTDRHAIDQWKQQVREEWNRLSW